MNTLLLILVLGQASSDGLKVVSQDLVLKDTKREKDLPIRVTWPDKGGKYPVIIFSHGMGGSLAAGGPLTDYWVERGYVVIRPTHEDSIQYASPEERAAFLRREGRILGDSRQRPADVTFVLNELGNLEKQVPELKGKMDSSKIGMSGHSYGAWTTMMIGGTKLIAGQRSLSYEDERPLALILLSPQGTGQGLTKESYQSMKRPTLSITGSKDEDPFTPGRAGEWRSEPFFNQPAGDKFLMFIDGADHSLGGINGRRIQRLAGSNDSGMLLAIQACTLAFWDRYLKGDSKAMQDMNAKSLTEMAKCDVKFERR
ncbi:hypothetical protein QPK87_31820 [Kamptonema cortianum]|nr:hypothetical protein [Kamptonema cortianum]